MNYKELQKRAVELGLKSIGVSKEDLEKSIKEAENGAVAGNHSEPEEDASEVATAPVKASGEPPQAPLEAPGDINTAVVYDGTREVRRYDIDLHGENFAELANQFAGRRGHRVELIMVELKRVECPSCGHKFNPK